MILEYHRPTAIEEALSLLARTDPPTVPLAGGTALNHPGRPPVAAVDLQDLGLDTIERRGSSLQVGAMVTLQELLGLNELQPALQKAILHEATYNLRQSATIAGTLVSGNGRSPFLTAMLALDPSLTILGEGLVNGDQPDLGDVLPLRSEKLRGRLITTVTAPLNVKLAYEYVARTPADRPIVCAAAAQWPSGRTRLTLGGFGDLPLLVLDGSIELPEAQSAAEDAYSQAGDEWASAEYRRAMAGLLSQRCLKRVNQLDEPQTEETP
jgi:CO/xanthine dehydrogenase FAD-binding subunit